MQQSNKEIHGHHVMEMMQACGKTYTRTALIADIVETFGKHAAFYTCGANGLTPAGLIDFLESKGKFTKVEGGFTLGTNEPCDHEAS